MRLIPMRVRRHWKRRRHARHWRHLEAHAFNYAPAHIWCHIRAWNDAARIWARHPERPRRNPPKADSARTGITGS